jgi:hypothetical protein
LCFAAAEDLKFCVASDSNYFQLAISLGCHAEGVTDGILIGPVLLGGALADYRDIPAVLIVRVSKGVAAQNADSHHIEVLRRYDTVARAECGGVGWSRCAVNDHRIATIADVTQRNGVGMAHGDHPGQLMKAGSDLPRQSASLRVFHSDLSAIEGHVEDMIGLESKIHGLHG